MTDTSSLFHSVMKLKTLCVGGRFLDHQNGDRHKWHHDNGSYVGAFPNTVLAHTEDFAFFIEPIFERALEIVQQDRDIDLVFIDADEEPLVDITLFVTRVQEIRRKLPIVVFTANTDDKMRTLMRAGAAWHFPIESPAIRQLPDQIHQHVFSPTNWNETFEQYASDAVKPRIEPGLSYDGLETLSNNPEERYIIKRLFANSDVVQIFRLDEGFSGSRIYTVKPSHQLKRILKIEAADQLESVQEIQERLIQPRLNQRVGQIQGGTIRGQHFAGACYVLAGSNRDTITLSQFLQDQNRVRRELIDSVLEQLRQSLDQLYVGSSDMELRYWAPLYARVLPTNLTLSEALLVDIQCEDADFMIAADEFTTLSAVPGNKTLQAINDAVLSGEQPTVVLRDFEVAELDTEQGVLYLHDDLIARYPIAPLLTGKDYPVLRFKVRLAESQREMLTHPVFRRGKRVTVRGRVAETQDTILANNIEEICGRDYDHTAATFELASAHFLPPIVNARYLLWELGREDMIIPIPQVSPVVHGDLNTSNILVEIGGDDIPVWLIDFSDARAGHVYFDLAKLEVEFRTHVLYRLYKEMVDDEVWTDDTATKFALLIESLLYRSYSGGFDEFIATLRDHHPDWYDSLYAHFPLYSENLLYFLFSLRQVAALQGAERHRYHYPVAIFFQSMAAVKYEGLDLDPWYPWAKRLALCCALTAGKQALEEIRQPHEVAAALDHLRQKSAFALITIGSGEDRKYLLQWNTNWEMFNLIGGKIDNEKGDRDSFARAIQRELLEELGLRSPRDYRIVRELKPVLQQQFSRREHVFKDYEFRLFTVEFLPRHPLAREDFERFAQRFSSDRLNVLISRAEIERLRTFDNGPISETTRMILHELGEIGTFEANGHTSNLDFQLDQREVIVSRGHAHLHGRLINPGFGNLIENLLLEVMPSPAYETDQGSGSIQIGALDAGMETPVSLWLVPKEKEAKVSIRATYYDARGKEHRQMLESRVYFDTPFRSHVDNPYVVGKPLTAASEALFVGREDIFMWIEENLIGKTQPHTLILHGQRRMGKTSTLYQLVDGQRGEAIRKYPGYPIFPVYIDLQRFASCSTPEFFERLSHEIDRHLQRRGVKFPIDAQWPLDTWAVNGHGYQHSFDTFLDRVEAGLPENGLLIVIIDELEQLKENIDRGKLSPDVLPYLRSLMQHRRQMAFILTGTNQLVEDYWSTIFHVGISREVRALNREETERLIREPVRPIVHYDELAVDRIWQATRGHPYFTQLICHRLISAVNLEGRISKVIALDDVQSTIGKVIEEDDSQLQFIWEESTDVERLVLSALAGRPEVSDGNLARFEVMGRLRDATVQEEHVKMALKRLETRSLVSAQAVERPLQARLLRQDSWQPALLSRDYTYTMSFDLLRRWVATKHPLGFLLN